MREDGLFSWDRITPVRQDTEHNPPHSVGNCFRACLASLLEVTIHDIPAFETHPAFMDPNDDGDWQKPLNDYLAEKGLFINMIKLSERVVPAGYCILTATSPIGKWGHCVIVKDGKQVFDPAGRDIVLTELWDYVVLLPITDGGVNLAVYPIRRLDEFYEKHGGWTERAKAVA